MKKLVTVLTVTIIILTSVIVMDRSQAKDMAIAQISGAQRKDILEFDADFDDGRLEYEGKIYFEGMEYEFEIDGFRDVVTKWEAQPIWR